MLHFSASRWRIPFHCDLFRKRKDPKNFLLNQQLAKSPEIPENPWQGKKTSSKAIAKRYALKANAIKVKIHGHHDASIRLPKMSSSRSMLKPLSITFRVCSSVFLGEWQTINIVLFRRKNKKKVNNYRTVSPLLLYSKII